MSTLTDEALEMTRISLLEQIQGCESHPNASIASQDRLKSKYNETIEKINDRKVGKLSDPIDIFPPEIWICILRHWMASIRGKIVKNTLQLTLVSKKWSSSLIGWPELWSEIAVGRGLAQPDMLSTLATCLYLSREYPLNVIVEHPTREWDLVIPVLLPHVYRIRSISIQRLKTKSNWRLDSNSPSAVEILRSFGHLPQLLHLNLSQPKDNILSADFYGLSGFISHNSSIKSITGTWMTPQILSNQSLKQIESIGFVAPIDKLLPWISRHPHLRSFYQNGSSDRAYPDEKESALFMSQTQTQLEALWFLSSLESRHIPLIKSSPNLNHLRLQVSWRRMVEFMNILDFLPLLNRFAVELKAQGSTVDAFEAPVVLPVTKVKKIEFGHRYHTQTEEALRLEHSNTRRLYDALKDCMPVVEDLTLAANGEFNIPHDYIASLSRLKSLHLQLPKINKENNHELRLSSVSLLKLNMSPNLIPTFISSIICDKLAELHIQEPENVSTVSETHTLELDPVTFKGLGELQWGHDVLQWIPTSMASLRIISFCEKVRTVPDDFCVYLIKRPYDCPALEEINFHDWPEWDLLFTMLERRNFLVDSKVSPIRLFSFPSTIAPFLRHALVDLLQRRFTMRPRNEELSTLSSKWDGRLCYHCWKSMQKCNFDNMSYQTMEYTTRRQCSEYVESLPFDPPVSPDIQDWLEKRQNRYDELHEQEADWMREMRKDTCSKHELGWRYPTSGYTLRATGAE